jgi:hypothetical protein
MDLKTIRSRPEMSAPSHHLDLALLVAAQALETLGCVLGLLFSPEDVSWACLEAGRRPWRVLVICCPQLEDDGDPLTPCGLGSTIIT